MSQLMYKYVLLIKTLIHVAVFDGIVWACILVDACVCWLGWAPIHCTQGVNELVWAQAMTSKPVC